MYVCCCKAITDGEIKAAIEGGAHTREAVTRACCAGSDCGACHGMIEEMIEEHLEAKAASERPSPKPDLVPAETLVRIRAA